MPRLLSKKPCILTLFDKISQTKVGLLYRIPTTDEQVAYTNGLVTKRLNGLESNLGGVRAEYGAKILVGVVEGSFTRELEDEATVPLSSDPASPDFDPLWKAHVIEFAADLIEMLAINAFEAVSARVSPDKEEKKDPL